MDPAPEGQGPMTSSRLTGEPLYQKGLWYQRHGQLEKAIAMYEETLRIAPHHPAAGSALLSATIEADAFEQACALGTQLHARRPDDNRVTLNLAIALVGCARPREAISLLDRQASRLGPYKFEICLHKGIAYRQLGEQRKAIAWYRKAEAIRPHDLRLLFNLALAFEKDEDYPQAVRYYRKYLSVLPENQAHLRERVTRRVTTIEETLGDAGRTQP